MPFSAGGKGTKRDEKQRDFVQNPRFTLLSGGFSSDFRKNALVYKLQIFVKHRLRVGVYKFIMVWTYMKRMMEKGKSRTDTVWEEEKCYEEKTNRQSHIFDHFTAPGTGRSGSVRFRSIF